MNNGACPGRRTLDRWPAIEAIRAHALIIRRQSRLTLKDIRQHVTRPRTPALWCRVAHSHYSSSPSSWPASLMMRRKATAWIAPWYCTATASGAGCNVMAYYLRERAPCLASAARLEREPVLTQTGEAPSDVPGEDSAPRLLNGILRISRGRSAR